ncbi:MAG: Eco57I restriction-modification methylase domain-containing protein [Bacteroidales bacterium]
MPLFQQSVVAKHLKSLDKKCIGEAYSLFKAHFHNPAIQENIRSSKEEQYQGEFLIDLFVNVLGYTKSPTPNYNLTTEYKNIKDSKKADGAILVGEAVKAVIELKGTNTTDLGKIEEQAFGYKNNQPECIYVVTSNFEKLRFYIDNAIEHIEFNLFTLSETNFELLYLCLSFESIRNGIPKKIKDESVSQEDKVTKLLYKDYSQFKQALYHDLVANNPQFDALVLFKKSQKLLDRFLFLFFAEDRHLLPPNSVRLILSQWQQLRDLDEYTPLYIRFMKYFGHLNTGYKGKHYDVFAYNGGLFKADEVLDHVIIDDDLLYTHTLKLSEYDFASEVDVNILGHIFENSLNELDEVKAQIEGLDIDKTKTKRKKDGVFYTPKYITKYIVDSTVGKLCTEKKAELQIVEDDFTTDKKRQLKTKQALLERLTAYRDWLLQITICDPACGSGAFLNQALDFLIGEHRYIDELQAKLTGATLIMSDIENSILENNLFGVDINEESVEIAKLSLWLRTAQPNRKLNDLSNNIKCGNSLIDDPAVAGDKAFDWAKEFPQVFGKEASTEPIVIIPINEKPDYLKLIKEKTLEAQAKSEQALALSQEAIELSKKAYEYAEQLEAVQEPTAKYGNKGFDVVIGNPPYGAFFNDVEKEYLEKNYTTYEYQLNSYSIFYEKGFSILKEKGILGFITPATFTYQFYFKRLRNFLQKFRQIAICKYCYEVFEDAGIGDSVSWITRKSKNDYSQISVLICNSEKDIQNESLLVDYDRLQSNDSTYNLSNNSLDISRFQNTSFEPLDLISEIIVGIKPYQTGKGTPKQTAEDVKEKRFTSDIKIDETFIKCVIGKDFHKYKFINVPEMYLSYGKWLAEPRESAPFFEEKIILRQTADSLICNLDTSGWINLNNVYNIGQKNHGYNLRYILSLLNSKLLNFLYQNISQEKGRVFAEVKKINLTKLPIKQTSTEEQQPFINKADQMLSINKELQESAQRFQRTIQRKFDLEDLPAKLQNWYLLSYKEFIAELGKKKIKLSLSQEAEWEDYFLQESQKTLAIKAQIDATDREIDQMVYALYGLTEDEIRIVEG